MAHALLSPSSAARWLACTPSARLEQDFPDRSSQAADEGTLAHSYGELMIRQKLGLPEDVLPAVRTKQEDKLIAEIKAHKLYLPEMDDYCDDYATFVLEQYYDARSRSKDAMIFLEQKLDLTQWVPGGFGTGDCIIIADGVLDITDLKYGRGVKVDAEGNRQMMLYGLGALEKFGFLYDISEVRMTIYQPRIDNYSTFVMTVADLLAWSENELAPRAKLAWDGQGDYAPGKHCQFCKAKAVCSALAEYNLELAKHEFKKPDLLADDDIAGILDRAAMFKNWIGAVEDHALHEAIHNSKKWPGYKIVAGRSNRKYTDEPALLKVLTEKAKLDSSKITKPVSLLPITQLEKAIGKEEFNTWAAGYTVKPPGKPALVPVTDKRPEMNTAEAAQADFADLADSDL